MSQTALYGDYFLPAAQHYEKIAFHIPTPHVMNLTFGDKAAEPAGEAKNEWEIYLRADPREDRRTCRGPRPHRVHGHARARRGATPTCQAPIR